MSLVAKSDLIHGGHYVGHCRNASVARWHAEMESFLYWRDKFDEVYLDNVDHVEDFTGVDVFRPRRLLHESEVEFPVPFDSLGDKYVEPSAQALNDARRRQWDEEHALTLKYADEVDEYPRDEQIKFTAGALRYQQQVAGKRALEEGRVPTPLQTACIEKAWANLDPALQASFVEQATALVDRWIARKAHFDAQKEG